MDGKLQTTRSLDLVVNWHVTEACNYRCGYCYAHWTAPNEHDVIRDPNRTSRLVQTLADRLGPGQMLEVGNEIIRVASLRLNFAGGEPLLFAKQVLAAMTRAKELGVDVSIITNGSRLNRHLLDDMSPLLSILGVSVDANHDITNQAIGRVDSRNRQLSVQVLKKYLDHARNLNGRLAVKLNTVVNAFNWTHDLNALIRELRPDQWKVFQMLPSIHRNHEVSALEFQSFVRRHRSLSALMRVEANDSMEGSYLMIDPHGRFYQNGTGEFGYAYSQPILNVGVQTALAGINWSPAKFLARYETLNVGSGDTP